MVAPSDDGMGWRVRSRRDRSLARADRALFNIACVIVLALLVYWL